MSQKLDIPMHESDCLDLRVTRLGVKERTVSAPSEQYRIAAVVTVYAAPPSTSLSLVALRVLVEMFGLLGYLRSPAIALVHAVFARSPGVVCPRRASGIRFHRGMARGNSRLRGRNMLISGHDVVGELMLMFTGVHGFYSVVLKVHIPRFIKRAPWCVKQPDPRLKGTRGTNGIFSNIFNTYYYILIIEY